MDVREQLGKAGRAALRIGLLVALFGPIAAAGTNVFRVHRHPQGNPLSYAPPLAFEDLELMTADGLRLAAWYIPAPVKQPKGAVLVCHGVGANREDVLPKAQFLAPAGYSCLLFEFRNHGKSQGRRCSLGMRETLDLRAGLAALERKAPGLPVGIFAQSMGAATAILAAADTPRVAAYVLDSPFASLWEMARENFRHVPDLLGVPLQYAVSFWGSLMVGGSIFDISPEHHVQELEPRPVLFIHGQKDALIPYEHSVRLHAAYRGSKQLWLVPDAWHVAAHLKHGQEYAGRVLEHFDRAMASAGGGRRP